MSVILCSFEEILDYLGHLKRPLVEGMRLHDSHHILEVGLIEFNRWVIKILGLVLQTSELKGKPHEVIIAKYLESKELLGTCSCKTGSGKCKHIIGVMLKHEKTIMRKYVTNIEPLYFLGVLNGGKWYKVYVCYNYLVCLTAISHYILRVITDGDLEMRLFMEIIHFGTLFVVLTFFTIPTLITKKRIIYSLQETIISGFFDYDGYYSAERDKFMTETSDHVTKVARVSVYFFGGALIGSYFQDIVTASSSYPLPYPGWFPFPTNTPLTYSIACIYHFLIGLTLITNCRAYFISFYSTANYVCAQFKILQFTLSKCLTMSKNYDKNTLAKTKLYRLKLCVKHQYTILRFYKQLHNYYNWSMFSVTVGMGLMLCTLGIQLTDPRATLASQIVGVILVFPEIGCTIGFCGYGQYISNHSAAIIQVLGELNWSEENLEIKKMILLMMTGSKELVLNGGLQELSLRGFAQIMQGAYSYFNMLGILRSK